ncbi:hypothetical protein [Asticcacaulis sp.]|uniref:hypothetical protein n=1 Tax=Asticcacaulis sp. TaxID=1872648 RepID=UPI0039E505D2
MARLRDGGPINIVRDGIERVTMHRPLHEGCEGPLSFNKYAVSASDFDRRYGHRYNRIDKLYDRPLDNACIARFYGVAGLDFWEDRGDITAAFVKLKTERLGTKLDCKNEPALVAELEKIGSSEFKAPLASDGPNTRVPEVYYEIRTIKDTCGNLAPGEGERLIKHALELGYEDRGPKFGGAE